MKDKKRRSIPFREGHMVLNVSILMVLTVSSMLAGYFFSWVVGKKRMARIRDELLESQWRLQQAHRLLTYRISGPADGDGRAGGTDDGPVDEDIVQEPEQGDGPLMEQGAAQPEGSKMGGRGFPRLAGRPKSELVRDSALADYCLSGQKRRRSARKRGGFTVLFGQDREEPRRPGVVMDLSAEGMGLKVNEVLEPGTRIRLAIRKDGVPHLAYGTVMWSKKVILLDGSDRKCAKIGVRLDFTGSGFSAFMRDFLGGSASAFEIGNAGSPPPMLGPGREAKGVLTEAGR